MLIERFAYDQPEASVESKVNTVPSAHQAYTQAKKFPGENNYSCVYVSTHTPQGRISKWEEAEFFFF